MATPSEEPAAQGRLSGGSQASQVSAPRDSVGSRGSAGAADGTLSTGSREFFSRRAEARSAARSKSTHGGGDSGGQDSGTDSLPMGAFHLDRRTLRAPSAMLSAQAPVAKPVSEEQLQRRPKVEARKLRRGGKRKLRPGQMAAMEDADPREMTFLEVEFSASEAPLGIVLDWSMALPVVSEIVQGYPASFRPALCQSLVLVATNAQDREIRPGDFVTVTSDQAKMRACFEGSGAQWHDAMEGIIGTEQKVVEVRERGRIIGLDEVVKDSGQLVWFFPAAIFTRREMLVPGESRERVEERLSRRPLVLFFEAPDWRRFEEAPWESAGLRALTASQSHAPQHGLTGMQFGKTALPDEDFLLSHPERAPLSRFGTLAGPPALFAPTLAAGASAGAPWGPRRVASEASLSLHGGNIVATSGRSRGGVTASDGKVRRPTRDGSAQMGSTRYTNSLAPDSALGTPDACYEEIVSSAGSRQYGPGPPKAWPLLHSKEFRCSLSDISLARCLRDAYEVGFRAWKFVEPPLRALERGEPMPRKRVVLSDSADFISCDVCGGQLASASAPPEKTEYFYYCKRCKQDGHRFEMCLACHAVEVMQAEAKHTGKTLHPHYLRCEHHALVRYSGVKTSYPGFPQLARTFCDCCGEIVKVEGDKNELYICPRCPQEDNSFRFELCKACAGKLSEFGFGVHRIFKNL